MKTENIRLIQRYLDKELSVEELSQFKKRYNEDMDFATDVKQFTGMIMGIREYEKKNLQNTSFNRFLKPLAIAASLLFIIFIGYFILSNKSNRTFIAKNKQISSPESKKENIGKDTVSTTKILPGKLKKKEINYLADNYRSNATIEKLIQQNYRSSSKEIEIVTPSDSAFIKANSEILFTIKIKTPETYNIQIYNNKFIKVFESKILDTESNKLNTGLSTGLYYWKIKSTTQSRWCGKFYVIE